MSDSNPSSDQSHNGIPQAGDRTPDAWDDTRVTAYVLGELSDTDQTAFESEMENDPKLAAAVDEARRLTEQLSTLFENESSVGVVSGGRGGLGGLDQERRQQIMAASEASGGITQSDPVRLVPKTESSQTSAFIREAPGGKRVVWAFAVAAACMLAAIVIVPPLLKPDFSMTQFDPAMERSESEQESAPSSSLRSSLVDEEDLAEIEAKADSVLDAKLEVTVEEFSLAMKPEPIQLKVDAAKKSKVTDGVALGGMMPPMEAEPEPATASQARSRQKRFDTALAPAALAPATLAPAAPTAAARTETLDLLESPANLPGLSVTADKPTQPSEGRPASGPQMLGIANSELLERVVEMRKAGRGRLGKEVKATLRQVDVPQGIEEESDPILLGWRKQEGLDISGQYDPIAENAFQDVSDQPRSTFSVDVDTASYSKVRRSLLSGAMPPANAVRIEELVNYFEYDYKAPAADSKVPFATSVTIASCPWNPSHRLARVALQGKSLAPDSRPPCNLVFLIDTSGSMNRPNKLPLVLEGMKMLTKQLTEKDRVAIVVYAGSAGLVLESTPANKGKKIRKALSELSAGGGTNGGAGIQLAYSTARDHFIEGGVNRVILCTDGDFNVGISGTDQLVKLIKEESSGGIFLTALGFGMDNHNDAMMEKISGKGNGNYAFIDSPNEARKVLVRQTDSTLVTIAKDVKVRVEFNPRVVSKYRLIGYENRVMPSKDFSDDKKDAGEIGAGHQVTALYELSLQPSKGSDRDGITESTDGLKYQTPGELSDAAASNETLTVQLRYKLPSVDSSTLIEKVATDNELAFTETDADFRFASAVASFGMLLRDSEYAGKWSIDDVRNAATKAKGKDEDGLRAEFIGLTEKAAQMRGGR